MPRGRPRRRGHLFRLRRGLRRRTSRPGEAPRSGSLLGNAHDRTELLRRAQHRPRGVAERDVLAALAARGSDRHALAERRARLIMLDYAKGRSASESRRSSRSATRPTSRRTICSHTGRRIRAPGSSSSIWKASGILGSSRAWRPSSRAASRSWRSRPVGRPPGRAPPRAIPPPWPTSMSPWTHSSSRQASSAPTRWSSCSTSSSSCLRSLRPRAGGSDVVTNAGRSGHSCGRRLRGARPRAAFAGAGNRRHAEELPAGAGGVREPDRHDRRGEPRGLREDHRRGGDPIRASTRSSSFTCPRW